jgi:peptide deformylase
VNPPAAPPLTAGALLRIVQVGDPVLRAPSRALTADELRSPELRQLIELMRATMYDAPGVGLAAPQVGLPLALAVIEDRAENMAALAPEELAARGRRPVPFHVLVNPQIELLPGPPVIFHEGCLSLEGFTAAVPRASAVRVRALDHRGEAVTIEADGWYARILQHEIDHLAGTVYIDRMDPRTFGSPDERARAPLRGELRLGALVDAG